MARKLVVEIVGDASSLDRALTKSQSRTKSFGAELTGMGKAAAIAGGAAGVALLTDALKSSVDVALKDQAAMAKLSAAFKASGVSAKAHAKDIDAAESAGRKLGFTNADVLGSLTKLIVPTKNYGQAVKDMGVAEDLARFKHIDLASASQILTGALAGNQRAVKQLGIVISPVTKAVDALKLAHQGATGPIDAVALAHAKLQDKLSTGQAIIDAVTQKVQGQSAAFAGTASGGMAQFSAQLDNVQGKIGAALLPVMTSLLNWVNSNWPTISTVVSDACKAIGVAIEIVKPIITSLLAPFKFVAQAFDDIIHGQWMKLWDDFKAFAMGPIDEVKALITTLSNYLSGPASAAWDAIKGAARAAMGAIHTAYNSSFAPAIDGIKSAFNWIKDNAASAWNTLRSAVSSVAGPIEAVLSGIASAARTVASAIQAVIDAASKLSQAAGGIPSKKIAPGSNTPVPKHKIPAASGGIFQDVPGGMIHMVEAGHPEAVIPLDPAKRGRAHQLLATVGRMTGYTTEAPSGSRKPSGAPSPDLIAAGKATAATVWSAIGHNYPGHNMPPIKFGGVPNGNYAETLARGGPVQFSLQGLNDLANDAPYAIESLAHEWAHAFQSPGVWATKAVWAREGGATDFARLHLGEALDTVGAVGGFQYPRGYRGYASRVMKELGAEWVNAGQFSAKGKVPKFADGGIVKLPKLGKNPKLNPTTGGPDVPEYRAAAMYLNDYGYDRNVTEVGTALAGLLGPRAQAQAAIRATYVDTPNGKVQLRHGMWRASQTLANDLVALKSQYPGLTFEGGTPGQQISWMQAASRLPMGGQELGSLIMSSLGPSGTGANTRGSLVEMLTSHAVHFAAGGIVTRPTFAMVGENGPEAIVPLGGRRQTTIVMQVDGRTLGKVALDYAHEQERWGGPVKVSR